MNHNHSSEYRRLRAEGHSHEDAITIINGGETELMERVRIIKTNSEALLKLQQVINEMKELPQYRQYVIDRKLSLLDSRFELADDLLKKGILT